MHASSSLLRSTLHSHLTLIFTSARSNSIVRRLADMGLCVKKKRFRLKLPEAVEKLRTLLQTSAHPLSHDATSTVGAAAALPAAPTAEPSPLSQIVRGMRRDPQQSVQRNVTDAFATCMRRLDDLYQAHMPRAPHGFLERIDFWHSDCGLPDDVHGRMHTLRVWRNASEHSDLQCGPRDAAEAALLIAELDRALTLLSA